MKNLKNVLIASCGRMSRRSDGRSGRRQPTPAPSLPLLAFKLSPPTAPRWLVARPRLFELLDAGVQGPVTVLIGPAGSGKTVLLSSWAATATLPGPVAWVSLDAADHLRDGLATARRADHDCLVVGFLSHLAAITAWSRPREGVRLAREALQLAERRGWSQNLSVACAYLVLGGAHFDWGDLAAADRYLDLAVACRPEPAISVAIDLTRAVVSHARGDTPAGLELLRAARQDLQRLHGPHALTASLWEWEARLLASTGRTEQAHTLLQLSGNGPRSSVATLAAWAELQLAEGDPAGALATLRPCLDGSASPLFAYQTLETLLLDAVARQRLGDHDGAAASVERALRIAEPEGYRQVFWNLGVEVRALLMRQRDRGSGHPQLLAELLETQAFAAPPAAASPVEASPVEPLTDRERTVLRYLSSELSTRQIADELYVSVNTVRSHVRSVYRKLDASRRGDAVRRARHLRLL